MNQGMYGEPYFHDQQIHATHSYTRKFCGCMSLQGGGILACLIWMVKKKEEAFIIMILSNLDC